ncbi:hypothetical protein [Staphylococcus debuckii]|uniref:hypothetical protein n=1 Tax=Staphylococcus debuckii TaxID=2044912 RepID=UPI000F4336AC|nr:hypothetical protein [Staphylococcus debuckii]AYU54100.1 hypothetical protein CNQ82_01050 [Staphylococcus debuckii]
MRKSKFVVSSLIASSLLMGTATVTLNSAEAAEDNEKVDIHLATPAEWQTQHDKLLESRLSGSNLGEGGGIGSINSYQNSYREYVESSINAAENQTAYGDVIVPKEGQEYLNAHGAPVENHQQPRQNIDPLPDTGKDSADTTTMTIVAGLFIAFGTFITLRKHFK